MIRIILPLVRYEMTADINPTARIETLQTSKLPCVSATFYLAVEAGLNSNLLMP